LQIQFSESPPADHPCDLLAIGIGTDVDGELGPLDERFGGRLTAWARSRKFDGKAGATLEAPSFGAIAASELMLVGVGDRSADDLRRAAGKVGRTARAHGAKHVGAHLGGDHASVIESIGVGNYEYEAYKKDDGRKPAIEQITVLGTGATDSTRLLKRLTAQAWCRDMVNAPAADIHPQSLAAQAQELADLPGVTVEIWDKARLEAEDCVGILAVGQGSERPPVMIRIAYRPPQAKAHIALVGKGVTFDAGGLSMKPSSGMMTMRCDMGGAATVLGITRAAADLGLPVAIDTYVGAVENMVSGSSYKLGDILRYRNGVNVEIWNTDAEGRLVLADCLIEASRNPDATHILDFATLTGACVVAVGTDFTGLFTDDDELAGSLSAAAREAGEGLWRLPLHAPYKELLKAEWGQIKNVGGRDAGATTAALFLQHFVEGKRWAHLDIAGAAFLDKASGHYAAGATGQMVRSVVTWLESL